MNACTTSKKLISDKYSGVCQCCNQHSNYDRTQRSIRESYSCLYCKASLRYRAQAQAIVQWYGSDSCSSLKQLSQDESFNKLKIYEPGVSGPFRKILSDLPNYQNSFYWEDVNGGDFRNGTQCENLENLTFDDAFFDLVLTSDIMEHVRRPWEAFTEIHRVLKPHGMHIFSIPIQLPIPPLSEFRVDTSGKEDINLKDEHYHGNGIGGRSLVYIDYGIDLANKLMSLGFDITFHRCRDNHEPTQLAVTVAAKKLANSD